jgi:hypothetical protein
VFVCGALACSDWVGSLIVPPARILNLCRLTLLCQRVLLTAVLLGQCLSWHDSPIVWHTIGMITEYLYGWWCTLSGVEHRALAALTRERVELSWYLSPELEGKKERRIDEFAWLGAACHGLSSGHAKHLNVPDSRCRHSSALVLLSGMIEIGLNCQTATGRTL